MLPKGLYPIVDTSHLKPDDVPAAAKALLHAGVKTIQLRAKDLSTRECLSLARLLSDLARRHGACFIVNDRVDITLASNAHGVHLGQDDIPVPDARTLLGPGKVIGLSTHDLKEVAEANSLSPDYISFGPIFPTRTKKDARPPVGVQGLVEAKKMTSIPITAIGGITLDHVPSIMKAGATAVSMVSGILLHKDVAEKALAVMEAIAFAER